jgi:hypothetical protein
VHQVREIGADVRPNWSSQPGKASQASSGAINERPPKKQAPESAAPGKQHRWAIYHITGTPAKLLGHVEAADEERAIEQAIEEFGITKFD